MNHARILSISMFVSNKYFFLSSLLFVSEKYGTFIDKNDGCYGKKK